MADNKNLTVDTAKVELYIRQAIAKNNKGLNKLEETLAAARVYLRDQRRRPEAYYDISMAAAEHYMLMRWLVCATGDESIANAPQLYKWKKELYFALGAEKRMATAAGPVLPPNDDVENFGVRGAREGWADYLSLHPRAKPTFGPGWKWLATEAYRL
jgi:hypothetical protein